LAAQTHAGKSRRVTTMVLGILQFELLIRGAESLKDKRRVVSSVKDRLRRQFSASVAEVGLQDMMGVARLGLALVGSDGRFVGQQLDRITAGLRARTDAELGDVSREVLHDPVALGEAGQDSDGSRGNDQADEALLADVMRRRASEHVGE